MEQQMKWMNRLAMEQQLATRSLEALPSHQRDNNRLQLQAMNEWTNLT